MSNFDFPIVTMTQKQLEMMHLLEERQRLLRCVRDSRREGDVDGALRGIISVLERIQVCDERYVELHRHCLAMIEQCQKILELDAMRRPIVMRLENGVLDLEIEGEEKEKKKP